MNLTKSQQKVFELIIQGFSNAEITDALCRSESCTRHHVTNILTKAKVKSRTELMAKHYMGKEAFEKARAA
jgi:DNA-binding NarL/FixJ family response regulator